MAVKWRKETFYTILVFPDGKKRAVLQHGCSDGRFNYYIATDGKWHAVLPDCGLSVATGETRTKCRNAAWKADIPYEDELPEEKRKIVQEAKRLINEKTVLWIGKEKS